MTRLGARASTRRAGDEVWRGGWDREEGWLNRFGYRGLAAARLNTIMAKNLVVGEDAGSMKQEMRARSATSVLVPETLRVVG
ncbi:hypothetical protein C0Q70_13731 [Pomacea canaliculata]|uniref:Uncharacterized protein n=1 Tax=Pomacea canaliculata TaxID=400727 RepID=A0A2T7NY47_POMCA|nr:hypothetical protein C0Q70_13731 [Pomacea canaliculata]